MLRELGYQNVELVVADGTLGMPESAPYDRILVAAAAAGIPNAMLEQLREDGILVIPVGDAVSQSLVALRKVDGKPVATQLSPCRFVPLVGAYKPDGQDSAG